MIVPLAYKYVAVAMMLTEIHFCSSRLQLSMDLPIQREDVKVQQVFPPDVLGFAGRIDTQRYSFCFAKSGRLRFITRLETEQGGSLQNLETLSRTKSILNTNDAYTLATNWLAAMDVDLPRLEKAGGAPKVEQQVYTAIVGSRTELRPLPIFDVRWGNWEDPLIDIQISGVDGQLIKLRQEDDSYSRRPAELIKDRDQLLAISDEQFQKLSRQERADLIARFSAVTYPAYSSGQKTNVSPRKSLSLDRSLAH